MRNRRHVALGTISFMVCFAAWGLIAAFAPHFRETFHLTASQTALLVAIPVLLGPLARIPMGILTDRFGGRAIFSILMAAVAIPVWIAPEQSTRLFQLRTGVPLWNSQAGAAIRADDEVRHVLRPHIRREEADVRHGLPQPGADLRYAGYHWRNTAGEAREHFLVWQSENHH
jgi:hypothetical protein